jgi:hypoxanthine phosphoribosyltransferase
MPGEELRVENTTELLDEAIRVRRNADIVHDETMMSEVHDRLARAIDIELYGMNPVILPVMIGGIYLCGELMRRLDFPLEVDYLHATRYRDRLHGKQLQWLVDPTEKIKDRVVLVLDDILDKGLTLRGIVDGLEQAGAEKVYTAVLTSKNCAREAEVDVNFVGIDVPDRYVFGCGMDYRGYWRNLPAIYAVNNS